MFFLIYGDDNFRSRRALMAAISQFQEKRDASGFNVVRLRADSDSLIRVQQELFASPFLAEKKLVVLGGYCRSTGKVDQENMVALMNRVPDSTAAIFFESADAKDLAKSPLFDLLKGQKFTAEYPPLTPAEASRFAVAEAAAAGDMKFEIPALHQLLEATGPDSWRIHQETGKLCARAAGDGGRKTVTAADVTEMVRGSQEQSIFAYLDACTDGKGTAAMVALESLMAAGEAEIQVIAMLQRHYRTIAMARDLMSRGLDQKTAAAKLGVHPFAAQKAWRAAVRYDLPFLGRCLRRLAQMEQDLKTGATLPRVGLGLFTAELAERACASTVRR